MNSDNCKIVPCSQFLKLRGTDKAYQDALEASSKFNRRLNRDRRTRIPFIDSQTRVAQANSVLWYQPYQRETAAKPEQLYTYPVKAWLKKRRIQFDYDSSLYRIPSFDMQPVNENSNSMDSSAPQHVPPPPVFKYQSHEGADEHRMGDDWNMHDEAFDFLNDNDNENESDLDDYEEAKRKKGKKGKGGSKKRSELTNDDKPFTCDKCGVKYKTKPGLTYHIQKMHNSDNSHNDSHPHRGSVSSKVNDDDNSNSVFDEDSHHAPNSANSNSAHASNLAKFAIANSINAAPPILKGVCATCGLVTLSTPEAKVPNDYLVSCCECTRAYHPLCLNFRPNMIVSVKKYSWQCIECKKCTICGNSENDDKLLFCDDCDRGFHMYCLNPPLDDAPDGDWRCELCVQNFGPQ